MSITTAKAAFEKGLKGTGSVTDATMTYEQGGKVQAFTFVVDGVDVLVRVPAKDDIITTVMAAAAEHAATKKG